MPVAQQIITTTTAPSPGERLDEHITNTHNNLSLYTADSIILLLLIQNKIVMINNYMYHIHDVNIF